MKNKSKDMVFHEEPEIYLCASEVNPGDGG